ncbi:MAG: RNA pseudouridine synthase [Myxococcota bacterium]|nr:RNA pseudouridine synthase [Myxococcota bacterium]
MPSVSLLPGRVEASLAHAVGLSRRVATLWLKQGRVQHEGRLVRKGERFLEPAVVQLEIDGTLGDWIPPASAPLPVLAEGAGWLSVNKPNGMHSHLSQPFEQGTALNSLVAHDPGIARVGDDPLQGGLVHRLDQDASGALLAASHVEVWRAFRRAFARGEVERIYRARVKGVPSTAGCDAPLMSAGDHVRIDPKGRACRTRWKPLDAYGLLEVDLLTGHRHQIRAHLAHIGSPILGDTLYHPEPEGTLQLHCYRLCYAGMEIVAPPPEYLEPR